MARKMDNEAKHLADVMLALQRFAFDRLRNRQSFEWRLCSSLWTVAAILAGFLLKGEIALACLRERIGLTVVAALMPTLHFLWIMGAGRRGRLDIHVSMFWDKQLRHLLEVKHDADTEKDFTALNSTAGQIRTYSFLFEAATTVVLSP